MKGKIKTKEQPMRGNLVKIPRVTATIAKIR